MTGDGTDALEQALALHSTPGRLPMLRARPLPQAVLVLIRIAAGDSDAVRSAVSRTSAPRQVVVEAAALYIQQVLFSDESNSYRVLGVAADDGDETIKEHYRWLMRWLHPDRNPGRWESVFSERVNRAWNCLSTEQRRRDYDTRIASLPQPAGRAGRMRTSVAVASPQDRHSPAILSTRTIRMLPVVVFAVLAICASVGLWIFVSEQPDRTVASESSTPATSEDDGLSAQEAAVRDREAFNERVIELSQPVRPPAMPVAAPSPVVLEPPPPDLPIDEAAPASSPATATSPRPAVADSAGATARVPTVGPQATIARGRFVALADPATRRGEAMAAAGTLHAAGAFPAGVAMSAKSRVATQAEVRAQSEAPSPALDAPALRQASRAGALSSETGSGAVHRDDSTTLNSGSAAVPAVPDAPQSAANHLVRQLEGSYASGDLSGLMRLFAPGAVNNRGGIDAIREDYEQLFHDSVARDLQLDGVRWVLQGDRLVGNGPFIAKIRRHRIGFSQRVLGWIQIEAVPVQGEWKIQSMRHRNTE